MELLLNFVWFFLALNAMAAGWMAGTAGRVSRLRLFLLGGCLSLLVFPIISVSDDLHALATECEDSSVRTPGSPKHATLDGANSANDALASWAANAGDLKPPSDESWRQVTGGPSQLPMQCSVRPLSCRPPPSPIPLVLVASTAVATQQRLGAASPSSDGGSRSRSRTETAVLGPGRTAWRTRRRKPSGRFRKSAPNLKTIQYDQYYVTQEGTGIPVQRQGRSYEISLRGAVETGSVRWLTGPVAKASSFPPSRNSRGEWPLWTW